MNAKLLFKTVLTLLALLLLLLVGLNNRGMVDFSLPPLINKVKLPSALMYFGFFALGFLIATVLNAGGGKKSSSGGTAKPAKAK